jgi:hypothetical protein
MAVGLQATRCNPHAFCITDRVAKPPKRNKLAVRQPIRQIIGSCISAALGCRCCRASDCDAGGDRASAASETASHVAGGRAPADYKRWRTGHAVHRISDRGSRRIPLEATTFDFAKNSLIRTESTSGRQTSRNANVIDSRVRIRRPVDGIVATNAGQSVIHYGL